MSYGLLLTPFLSGFIGWFANWVAIKMLFHPRKPLKIAGYTLQGLLPKRQKQIAEQLGKLVSTELFSLSELEQQISNPANFEKIMPYIAEHVDRFLRVKLAEQMPMISLFIGEKTIIELKTVFTAELQALFPVVMEKYMNELRGELDLETMITEKITHFSSDRLEQILNSVMSKEFRLVALIGGGIGFIIGLLQVFTSLLL
jgi:uncharacterized membrane protein YheB (UPF0754 family)